MMTDTHRDDNFRMVLRLQDLVQNQEGSVAGRIIVNRKAGTILPFSFDKDEGLSERTAPCDAVKTILNDEYEARVAGLTHRMRGGETIIFPANVIWMSATTRFKMMPVRIRE